MIINDIIDYLKNNPLQRNLVLRVLLEDESITISELVNLRETALLERLGKQKEEIANGYALVLRYKEGINKRTLNDDAQKFLSESSYTGLGKYEK